MGLCALPLCAERQHGRPALAQRVSRGHGDESTCENS